MDAMQPPQPRPTHAHVPKFRVPLTGAITALLGVVVFSAGSAHGADGSWTPTTATNFTWSTAANWTGSTVANGVGSTATFNSNLVGDETISILGGQTIGNILF